MVAGAADTEDRRFTFSVTAFDPVTRKPKKSFVLQALNTQECQEWIATIMNIAGSQPSPGQKVMPQKGPVGGQKVTPTVEIRQEGASASSPISIPSQDPGSPDSGTSRSLLTPTMPAPPPPTPLENTTMEENDPQTGERINFSAPIQFDLLSDYSEPAADVSGKPDGEGDGTQVTRQNPFGAPDGTQKFPVKFSGSMDVPSDHGDRLVTETMRQVTGARSAHGMTEMTSLLLYVTDRYLVLCDPEPPFRVRSRFDLSDVSHWAVGQDSKLFGLIVATRAAAEPGAHRKFTCYVLESDIVPASELCALLDGATRTAFENVLARGTSEMAVTEREKEEG